MKRIRQRIKEVTPRSRCHADIRAVIAQINPILRGWGEYLRTGNAATKFQQVDDYVRRRLVTLKVKQKGRHLKPGEVRRWTRDYFHQGFGLVRLAGELRGGIALRARGARRVQGRRTALASLRKAVALARRQGARALVDRARESLDRLE